jgi:DNA-binding NtrC family response regulator
VIGRLLVVDDDPIGCRVVMRIMEHEGYETMAAHDGEACLARAAADHPDLVILDLELPKLDGIQVLERLKAAQPNLPVIMLTGHYDVKATVRAMRLGAYDYLTKPVNSEELTIVVRRALQVHALESEVEDLRRLAGGADSLDAQMGPSLAVRQITEQVKTVAATNFSVMVLGETGTGKELVAHALHRQSERRAQPFVALDCGAIPEPLLESELFGHEKGAFTGAVRRKAGHFHLADSGTLFLDEIGNLPLSLQAKLLRVLESRQLQAVGASRSTAIDVRFIAATNDDIQKRVAEGRFRPDLYFRLAQYTITLPPLRDRPEDIPHLARRFVREVGVELRRPVQGITAEGLALLRRHPWPGNVRELRNVIRQAVLESKGLVVDRPVLQRFVGKPAPGVAHGAPVVAGRSLKEIAAAAAREAERQAINETLRAALGNKSQAARALKTDFKTLHLKMKSLGIRARDYSP